jgi:spermidine/putrescine-binding protein
MVDIEPVQGNERALLEEFALGGINAAVQFVKESDIEPSTMLAALGSMFWTYLMMISPASAASGNIDNAIKYMNHSAEEARSRIQEMDWAERMTHNEMGNA